MTLQKKINLSLDYKLVQGEHLTDKDKNKSSCTKIWRKRNGLKVGDKVRLKSNLYDADNEKGDQ